MPLPRHGSCRVSQSTLLFAEGGFQHPSHHSDSVRRQYTFRHFFLLLLRGTGKAEGTFTKVHVRCRLSYYKLTSDVHASRQGLKISEATYDCVWYRMGRAPRMLLSIIMARAQRSPSLKAGSVITVNLRAFLHVSVTRRSEN